MIIILGVLVDGNGGYLGNNGRTEVGEYRRQNNVTISGSSVGYVVGGGRRF